MRYRNSAPHPEMQLQEWHPGCWNSSVSFSKSGAAVEPAKLLWQRLPNQVLLLAQLLAGFLVKRRRPHVFWWYAVVLWSSPWLPCGGSWHWGPCHQLRNSSMGHSRLPVSWVKVRANLRRSMWLTCSIHFPPSDFTLCGWEATRDLHAEGRVK